MRKQRRRNRGFIYIRTKNVLAGPFRTMDEAKAYGKKYLPNFRILGARLK